MAKRKMRDVTLVKDLRTYVTTRAEISAAHRKVFLGVLDWVLGDDDALDAIGLGKAKTK